MELTTGLMAVIIITGLTSSSLSLGAKLMYDGIKAKRNGANNNSKNNNNIKLLYGIQSSIDLLSRDVDEGNREIVELKRPLERLTEVSIETNVHLRGLKKVTEDQTRTFRNLVIALTTAIAKIGG